MGTQLPLPKEEQPPSFGPYLLWPNGWMKMPLGMEVGLSPGDFVLDGDSAPPAQKWCGAPQLSAHVYCGQSSFSKTTVLLGTSDNDENATSAKQH